MLRVDYIMLGVAFHVRHSFYILFAFYYSRDIANNVNARKKANPGEQGKLF